MMEEYHNRQLLCTFSNNEDYRKVSTAIKEFYEVYNNRVFAFSNIKNPKEIYLTYNVLNVKKDFPKFPNTILTHRKKQYNVIYTLNALNVLIKEECGSLNSSFILDWKLYANSLIITGDISIKIIPLKIISIGEQNKNY